MIRITKIRVTKQVLSEEIDLILKADEILKANFVIGRDLRDI